MTGERVEPAAIDGRHWQALRDNVAALMRRAGERWAAGGGLLLDIAPQDHAGARPFFGDDVEIETLDIDPDAGATYVADITRPIDAIADGRFDFVVCTEVLEHTLQPFDAVAEIHRVLRPGGLLFLSVPFNFRIHGPLPDCWRFTEHGLRALLADFELLELEALETPDRPLMPIHYTAVARKPGPAR
jgi:SAM-dependent methyltransferase